MPNAWDAVSALILKAAGFAALGTSSAALAATLGRLDGRHTVSRRDHLEHAQLLARVSGLPLNGDFEDGYGQTPDEVAETVAAAIAAGLAGIGIEDTSADPHRPIRPFDESVARMKAAAQVANGRILLTGRTDTYLYGAGDLDETLRRLTAFAEVGADVLFAPLPNDMDDVVAIVQAVAPKPVNLGIGTRAGVLPATDVLAAGVKRISLGASLYTHAMKSLQDVAYALVAGDLAAASTGTPLRDVSALIARATL